MVMIRYILYNSYVIAFRITIFPPHNYEIVSVFDCSVIYMLIKRIKH
jgi:hypothetical protein